MHNPGINGLKLIKHQNLINAYSNMFKKILIITLTLRVVGEIQHMIF